jgi:hypothetical protein
LCDVRLSGGSSKSSRLRSTTIGREQVASDAFNKVRNQVWLSVRRQANAAEAQHEPTAA